MSLFRPSSSVKVTTDESWKAFSSLSRLSMVSVIMKMSSTMEFVVVSNTQRMMRLILSSFENGVVSNIQRMKLFLLSSFENGSAHL